MIHRRSSILALLAILLSTANAISRQSREVTLTPAPVAAPQRGSYYALVIGINSYRDFPTLKTPHSDATEVARALKNRYGFVTNLLLDATRDQIIGALDQYISQLHEEDSLLIYFAGHGWKDKSAGDAYWIPVDGQKNTRSRWITAADITDEARAIPARHLLIISDSCFSGTLAERNIHPTVGITSERTLLLEKLRAGKSRHLMSSGGDEPVSDDSALGHDPSHSVFANALLDGLTQMQPDEFTGRELFDQYVFGPVGGQSKQVPEYNLMRDSGHNSGDFIFFRKQHMLPDIFKNAQPSTSNPVAAIIPAQPPASNTISLSPDIGKLGTDLWVTGTLSPRKRVSGDVVEIGQLNDGTRLRGLLTFDLSKIPRGSQIAHAELKCKIGGSVIRPADARFYPDVLLESFSGFFVALSKDAFDSEAKLVHNVAFADIEKPLDVTEAVVATLSRDSSSITFRFRFDQDDSIHRQLFTLNTHFTTLKITLK